MSKRILSAETMVLALPPTSKYKHNNNFCYAICYIMLACSHWLTYNIAQTL
ncbi:MAG TPA: hypothetical protein PLK15_03125 [Chitinophagales bacterium]|nr:hypothetical protein [Chitinophagales bacterium]